jgi:outer membrane protein OmpA-like peptidoglycan-associated protein
MKTQITLFLLITFALSSCGRYYIKKGDAYYKTMQYDKAIDKYTKSLSKKPSDEVKIKIADSYRLNNDYKNAEKWYSEVVTIPGVEPINLFYYAKVLMNNENYKDAKIWFTNYLKLKDTDPVATTLIASCDSFNKLYADSTRYALKTVDIPEVTTAFAQVNYKDGIVFAADKETFTSMQKQTGWTGRSYLDLYFSKKNDDGTWAAPKPLQGEVNGLYHEGPAVFNKEGNIIYFTRSNYSGTRKLKKNDKDESNLALFRAELKDSSWTNLQAMPFNSNEYSCGHPALSQDGKTLYFISDMPGGMGGTDIYKVTSKKNKDSVEEWSAPENLGSAINTAGNEMFPYLHRDSILYFSSDAHNTLGGLDIFSSSFDGKSWSSPENLNYPINSSKDDFAFVLNDDNKTGYISSNRKDLDKIYEIRLADPVFVLKGKVTAKATGEPLAGAIVEVTNNKDEFIQSLPVDEKGNYATKLKAGVEYKVQAIMEGYLKPEIVTVSTENKKKSETFKVNFQLEKLELEKPIVLENIYYDLDKWKIRKDAALELDKFAALLNANPQITVELSSHTDARANDRYNQVLSEKRAKSAVEYLIKNGIDPNRLKWKGYGESVLVNGCGNGVTCKEEEHQQNRRTEFKVIRINEIVRTK